MPDIVVVKKTICFSSVFFYNHLYQPSVFRNLFFKSGINRKLEARKMILSIYVNQTTHKNQGSQYDLDRSAGKIHKVQGFRVHRSRVKI